MPQKWSARASTTRAFNRRAEAAKLRVQLIKRNGGFKTLGKVYRVRVASRRLSPSVGGVGSVHRVAMTFWDYGISILFTLFAEPRERDDFGSVERLGTVFPARLS